MKLGIMMKSKFLLKNLLDWVSYCSINMDGTLTIMTVDPNQLNNIKDILQKFSDSQIVYNYTYFCI